MKMKAYLPPLEGRRSKIRLDFNENTVGFPERVPELEPTMLTAYPEYHDLIEGVAQLLGLPSDWLLLTNGSDEALFVAAFTFIEPDQDRAIISAPTFSLIPHYLQLCQAIIEEVVVHDDLSYNLEGIEEALQRGAKLAILPSPDNPTGGTIPLDLLRDWLRRFPRTLFVIDEAYYEYYDQTTLVLLPEHPNLLVTRTFSKAWGLAGLRLGVVAGHPQLMEWIRRVRSPYSVNSMVAQALLRLLPQKAEVMAQARAAVERKGRVVARIRQAGYRVTPGAANFFLIWAGLTSKAMAAFLNARGLLVRDRSNLAKMGGSVRVSVGSEEEMETFLRHFETFNRGFGLIFDLDDTLVDTSRSYDECVQRLSGASREEVLALRAQGGFNDDWETAAELLRRGGRERPLEEVVAEGKQLYLRLAADGLLEPPHFRQETLDLLGRRHPLLVFTGRPRDEYEPVWQTRIAPHFRDVLCKDDVPQVCPKPAPDGLVHLMRKHDLVGGAYVGNSVDDMAAAKAAGLIAIGFTSNQSAEALQRAGADFIVGSLEEIPGLLLLKGEPS